MRVNGPCSKVDRSWGAWHLRDVLPNFAQLRPELSGVVAAHADHDFLAGGTCFQLRIGVLEENFRLYQLDRLVWFRRRQKIVDGLNQTVVEIPLGIADFDISALKQRVELAIQIDQFLGIDGLDQPDIGRVALRVLHTDGKRIAFPTGQESTFHAFQRHHFRRQILTWEVVHGDDNLVNQGFGLEQCFPLFAQNLDQGLEY